MKINEDFNRLMNSEKIQKQLIEEEIQFKKQLEKKPKGWDLYLGIEKFCKEKNIPIKRFPDPGSIHLRIGEDYLDFWPSTQRIVLHKTRKVLFGKTHLYVHLLKYLESRKKTHL